MVQSYTQNPTFGDPKIFQEELESVILKVQKLEYELHSLNLELNDVNYQLGQKCRQKSSLPTPQIIHKQVSDSPEGSRSSSAGYGTISNCSSIDGDSFETSDTLLENSVTAVALYSYAGDCSESSIAMEAGEEFIVTEGDEGGWTKVRRKNINSEEVEGFVPTAYLQWMC
jgi:hypothetical protein